MEMGSFVGPCRPRAKQKVCIAPPTLRHIFDHPSGAARRDNPGSPHSGSRPVSIGGICMTLARPVSICRVALFLVFLAAIPAAARAQQREFEWPDKAKNLRVLPKNISKDDLRSTMV